MSLLSSGLRGVNPDRDSLVSNLREYLDQNGGPNWRVEPRDLPIKFSGVSENTVWVDVQKADEAWRAPGSVRRRITCTGDNEIDDRGKEMFEHIAVDQRPLNPSRAYYDPDKKSLDFGDGRHRFALLRDAGCLCLPMDSDTPSNLAHLKADPAELRSKLAKVEMMEKEALTAEHKWGLHRVSPQNQIASLQSQISILSGKALQENRDNTISPESAPSLPAPLLASRTPIPRSHSELRRAPRGL
jgi:hypothetical protein